MRHSLVNGSRVSFLLMLALSTLLPLAYGGQSNQIVTAVNESDLVQLNGSTHPLARAEFDEGLVADGFRMDHMFVVLRRSSEGAATVDG
jgi:hypothetical protein